MRNQFKEQECIVGYDKHRPHIPLRSTCFIYNNQWICVVGSTKVAQVAGTIPDRFDLTKATVVGSISRDNPIWRMDQFMKIMNS